MKNQYDITEELIKEYYEKNPEGVPGTEDIPEIFEMHQIFKRRIKKLKVKRLLDAGCGKGYMGEEVRELVKKYVGFDISKSALKIAKNKIPKGVFHSGTLRNLPFMSNTFI